MKKIAILFGGVSLEHEISIITALQVLEHIDRNKYQPFPIYIDKKGNWWTGDQLADKDFYRTGKNDTPEQFVETFSWSFQGNSSDIDAALLCFHGGQGEGGGIQGVIEAFDLPYQGPNPASSAVAMDKIFTRQILHAENISQPQYGWFTIQEYTQDKAAVAERMEQLGFPLYLKVATSGSSIGVKKVGTMAEVDTEMQELSLYGDRLIFEREVSNCIEVNISVMGTQDNIMASVSEQPIKTAELLSFDDKYAKGGKKTGMASANRRIPAPISESLEKKLQDVAKRVFTILNCEGVVRIDFFANPSTEEYFLIEVNTIPGSLSFYLWQHDQMEFPGLIDRLIEIAEKRQQHKHSKITVFENNLLAKL